VSDQARLRAVLDVLRPHLDGPRQEQVTALERRLAANRLRVLLVGEAKRGKSTLGNVLLGREVLPTGVVPVTAITTTVRAGSPERLEVTYVDGTVRTLPLDELPEQVTETGNPGNRRQVASVTAFLDGPSADGHRSDGHPSDGSAKWEARGPAESGTSWLASGIELVDTPGVGSVYVHNTTEADAALATMDAALFVVTADPPVSASELDLLRHVQELSVRTYVVLNKADRMTPAERREVVDFTRRSIEEVTGRTPDLFVGSALQGLRALTARDSAGWAASGMRDLVEALTGQLSKTRERDLVTSLAKATGRLVRGLLDETALTLRAHELRANQRAAELQAFRTVLQGLGRRRDEALAVAVADLKQARRTLDAAAAAQAEPITTQALRRIDETAASLPGAGAAELEDAAHAALVQTIRPAVETWRQERARDLETALHETATRQQELLEAAVGVVRDAAAAHLGVRLHAEAAEVALPDPGRYYYSFADDIGWSQPVDAAVRRHLPGDLGRRRVRQRLRTRAAHLADVHLGRARADFQARLDEAGRALTRAVARSYDDMAGRLGHALDGPPAEAGAPAPGVVFDGAGQGRDGAGQGRDGGDTPATMLVRRQELLQDLSEELDDMVRGVDA
jgi:hypothetical protein